MTGHRLRVGIVGLQPGRSWAARAHIPALRALSESYEIVGVANTSLASAEKAAVATGLPRAFADVAEKKISAYLLDRANGATMLTIPVGHTLAALMDVLGEVAEVSAVLATRRTSVLAVDTGETSRCIALSRRSREQLKAGSAL
jgi:predicted dehydrogenase